MRVVSESKWELIAAHRPRWLPLILVLAGVSFASAALLHPFDSLAETLGAGATALFFVFSAYMASTTSEFTFDATSRKVKWQERRPFAAADGVIAFSEIKGVAVQTNEDSEGKSCRVVLHTNAGDTPLTRHYSGIEPHEEDTARRIATWLRAHNVELTTG
jgi:hypothetical protein